jgi:hypothetical protein
MRREKRKTKQKVEKINDSVSYQTKDNVKEKDIDERRIDDDTQKERREQEKKKERQNERADLSILKRIGDRAGTR